MAKSSTNKVIVVGCKHGGLAVIRALGQKGLHVIAVAVDPDEFGMASRYVAEQATCPDPADTQTFADFLLDRADDWQGALILDTEDYFTTAISQHKEALSERYAVVTSDWQHTQLFIEKHRTYELADVCGVPHPALHLPTSLEELDEIIDGLVYPLMMKPVRSHEFVSHFGEKLFIVDEAAQLRERFRQTLEGHQPVMIQEIIPGTDKGTLESIEVYINKAGDVTGEQFNIKLRQSPPMFGIMRMGKSVSPIPDIQEHALKMLSHIDYRGYASFEFKRDMRDGLPKLIEVNVRIPRNVQLLIASGVNFPWIIYKDFVLNQREVQRDYNPMYFIDIIPDLGNSLFRDFQLLVKPLEFINPYLSKHKTFAVLSLSDYAPFLKHLASRISKVGRKVRSQLRG